MNPTKDDGTGRKSPRKFDETFKRHAVELSLRGDRKIKELAQELGITEWTLYRWRCDFGPRPGRSVMAAAPHTLSEAEEEIRRLRAENVRLREREIVLKKSLGILSETPERSIPGSKR
jgi:transposase-like protein